ncbi:MAG: hypothetical protein ACK583_17845 [Cyanobacteriota bacterium]
MRGHQCATPETIHGKGYGASPRPEPPRQASQGSGKGSNGLDTILR